MTNSVETTQGWNKVPESLQSAMKDHADWRDMPDVANEDISNFSPRVRAILEYRDRITECKKAVDCHLKLMMGVTAKDERQRFAVEAVSYVSGANVKLSGDLEDDDVAALQTRMSALLGALEVLLREHWDAEDILIRVKQEFSQPAFAIQKELLVIVKAEKK